MIKNFINRPVLSTVISILIVILGVLGLISLPVTQYPDIAPPTVSVSANYTGANAETVMKSVVVPLEEQINGVEGMDYITSSAGNDGSAQIQVFFKQGIDPDIAAVNVQNRVARATPLLPSEVTRSGVVTQKQQTSALMYMSFYSENKDLDDVYLQNFLNINIIPNLKRVNGVGDANVFGGKNYSMRIWLDPAKMAAYSVTPTDVTNAINEQSREAAAGSIGQNSGSSFEYIIKYVGKFNDKEQYDNIIIKSLANGQNLMLKDVAKVELAGQSYTGIGENGNNPSISMGIFQTPGSNAQEIIKNIKAYLKSAESTFPQGVKYTFNFDTNEFLEASIEKVVHTLIEAFILVFIVVYIFLQDFRSTLIPAIAVPVSIVGAFFFLNLFGYSLNLLTLFALVLAIGIVVDDAIVVVEAVHAKMEHGIADAKKATVEAMDEITGAIISITLVMSAVFIPIGFMSGSAGLFYKQFAYTLAIAIIISAVNALTLTPALCAVFLKNHHAEEGGKPKGFGQRFAVAFNAGFNNMTNRYAKGVKFLIGRKWIAAGLIAGIIGLSAWLMTSTPKSFVPMEDDGFFIYSLSMPPGTGLTKTTEVSNKINTILKGVDAVQENTSITGFNLLSNSAGPAYAMGFVKLKPKKERGAVQDIDEIMNIVNGKLAEIKEGSVISFRMPPVEGYGVTSGSEIVLQDRMSRDPQSLKAKADDLIGQLMQVPEVAYAYTMFRADYPQLELEVNEDKAKQLGVSISQLLGTVQTYFSGDQSQNFSRFGKFYRVNIKADGVFRMDEQAFNDIFVKNDKGEMVPVNTLVTLKKVYGPESVQRYNLYNSLNINVVPKPGVSNGALMDKMEQTLSKLPSDYSYEWTGLSLEEKSAGNQTVVILGLCLLFVYLLLSAQYESYILPLAVMLSIPTGVLGAFLGIKAIGFDNNIYVQVGLIMLIGLLAKNAILIVEFAVQRRKAGLSILDSALEGAKARLRPIIMTSLAFIVGMIPLMISTGGMASGNKSISVSAAIGMLSGVILGVFVIPVLYMFFQYLDEKFSSKKKYPVTQNQLTNENI